MVEQNWSPDPIRRVITGHDENNVAKALIDGPSAYVRSRKAGSGSSLIWCTDATPSDISIGEDFEDMGARELGTYPPPGGARFIVMQFEPGLPGTLHRTETIDYITCIEGEIDMDMDDSTITLKPGDVMVQRGTNHSWVNRGTKTAKISIVLVDAQPLDIGDPVPRGGVVQEKH